MTWPWILPCLMLAVSFVGTIAIACQGHHTNVARHRYYRRLRYEVMAVGIAMIALGVFGLVNLLGVSPMLYMVYCSAFLSLMGPIIALETITSNEL